MPVYIRFSNFIDTANAKDLMRTAISLQMDVVQNAPGLINNNMYSCFIGSFGIDDAALRNNAKIYLQVLLNGITVDRYDIKEKEEMSANSYADAIAGVIMRQIPEVHAAPSVDELAFGLDKMQL